MAQIGQGRFLLTIAGIVLDLCVFQTLLQGTATATATATVSTSTTTIGTNVFQHGNPPQPFVVVVVVVVFWYIHVVVVDLILFHSMVLLRGYMRHPSERVADEGR